MENKIITLSNNEEYVILKDANIDNKRYVLCAKYDEQKEIIEEDSLVIAEVVLEENNLKLLNINDQQVAEKITNEILNMMKKSD